MYDATATDIKHG